MKTPLLLITGIVLLGLESPVANAQNTMEIPGGPTATLSPRQLETVMGYTISPISTIRTLLSNIKKEKDPSSVKSMLVDKLWKIQEAVKNSPEDINLIFRHAIVAGLNMNNLIQSQTISKGPKFTPPGTIRQQSRIMLHTVELAKEYYQRDEDYVNGTINKAQHQKQMVEFGKKLTRKIIEMSEGVNNIQAQYGMIRWSLGVLQSYLVNNEASASYKDQIGILYDGLNPYPDLMNLRDGQIPLADIQCPEAIMKLKLLAKNAFVDL